MKTASFKKLHLGCGRKILHDYINIDIIEHEGVDIVHDITTGIPFEENEFQEVLCIDFIEHIPSEQTISFMNEVYRVLVPGGIFKIHVPEAPGITAFQDPTHISYWNEESFTYYLDGHRRRENYGIYYGITARFRLASLKRTPRLRKRFFQTLNFNYLMNYHLDIELVAIK